MTVADLCREHGISQSLFYEWRSKFGGMDAPMMKRLKELDGQNNRLKKMYSEERLKAEISQEALEGKLQRYLGARRWRRRPLNGMASDSGFLDIA